MTWTRDDIPDQRGRVAVVTGANGGLGLETALGLAGAGAHVVMVCRNPAKTDAALARIRAEHPDASLEVVACDLSSQRSVRASTEEIRGRHERVDLLIANAGVMAIPRRITDDGWEMQLATNHLGHWTFTALLIDRMLPVDGSRVVVVTSEFHKAGRIDFDDLHGDRRYSRWKAYAQSKLANLLFASELSRRLLAGRHPTIAGAAHPGYSATDLQAVGPKMGGHKLTERVIDLGNRLIAQSSAMGALPTLYAATAPNMVSGMLIGPDGLFDMRGHPEVVVPSKRAQDPVLAKRLWAVSEELTGVSFPI
jgi:NAD(P)-dependent dehydrogenase (short-subunit alcohol dehydrogenase family)